MITRNVFLKHRNLIYSTRENWISCNYKKDKFYHVISLKTYRFVSQLLKNPSINKKHFCKYC